jgi:hypothetical protein
MRVTRPPGRDPAGRRAAKAVKKHDWTKVRNSPTATGQGLRTTYALLLARSAIEA